jgi:hypothetical protein
MVLGTPTGTLSADSAYGLPHPPENKIHDSLQWFWWPLQLLPQQYYDKDDAISQWRVPFGRPRSIPDGSILHESAERRLRFTAQDQKPYRPPNLLDRGTLHKIHRPLAETTARVVGSFILKTPDGKASVPDDPTLLRYAKLLFGWVYFGLFWLFVAALVTIVLAIVAIALVLLLGVGRILIEHLFHYLNQGPRLHALFGWIHERFLWLPRFHTFLCRWLLG